MKLCTLILLATLAVPANAAPVHVALKSAVMVTPNADGFFTLASIADLTGGDAAQRTRLAAVTVGRAPLSGETRLLTRGDLALKLRQAGCNPDTDTLLEGSSQAEVMTQAASPVPIQGSQTKATPATEPAPPLSGAGGTSLPLIHRGAAVTIIIQSGALSISASGTARENGNAGDTIRVHRDGVMTDLSVTVLDSQTVQLEI